MNINNPYSEVRDIDVKIMLLNRIIYLIVAFSYILGSALTFGKGRG